MGKLRKAVGKHQARRLGHARQPTTKRRAFAELSAWEGFPVEAGVETRSRTPDLALAQLVGVAVVAVLTWSPDIFAPNQKKRGANEHWADESGLGVRFRSAASVHALVLRSCAADGAS